MPRPAFKPSAARPDAPPVQVMAEPLYRVGPPGVSSGASVREAPSACVEEVRRTCHHYVEKCAGKYTDNKTAARYVHQMAKDILSQLAGVAAEIRAQESTPAIIQELLDEWNKQFPPSLKSYGTPKHIAATLQKQHKEIAQLQEDLKIEKTRRTTDLESVMRSMDGQLKASRDSVIGERHQLSLNHDYQIKEMKNLIKDLKLEHKSNLRKQKKAFGVERKGMQHNFDNKFEELQGELREKDQQMFAKVADHSNKEEMLHVTINDKDALIRKLEGKIQKFKLSKLRKDGRPKKSTEGLCASRSHTPSSCKATRSKKRLSTDGGDVAENDDPQQNQSGIDDEYYDDDYYDDDSSLESNISLPTEILKSDAKKSVENLVRMQEARVISFKGKGAIAAVKSMKRFTNELVSINRKLTTDGESLKAALNRMLEDKNFQDKYLRGLEEANATLRKALNTKPTQNVKVTRYTSKPLNWVVPDFLMQARTNAL
jgi:hypothetical protein